MEQQIKELISKLSISLHKEIIGIIYNPFREEGIQKQDVQFLTGLLRSAHYTYPLIILHGPGGNFVPAVYIPYIIKKYVNKYKVFVPGICSSALCYAIFKAEELIIMPNTKITQIDPKFNYNGEELRAINHLHCSDPDLKNIARKVFDVTKKQVEELIKPPSIFKYKNLSPGEFQHIELIVDHFMNKEKHETSITTKGLEEVELSFIINNSEEIGKVSKLFIERCVEFMLKKEVRVIFISSIPLKFENEEWTYVCPLK